MLILNKVLCDCDCDFNYTERIQNDLQDPVNLVMPLESLYFCHDSISIYLENSSEILYVTHDLFHLPTTPQISPHMWCSLPQLLGYQRTVTNSLGTTRLNHIPSYFLFCTYEVYKFSLWQQG